MRALLLCVLFACRGAVAAPAPVPFGVPPPADANSDAILPLPPIIDALPQMDAPGIPK
jgi:hypothetical protein